MEPIYLDYSATTPVRSGGGGRHGGRLCTGQREPGQPAPGRSTGQTDPGGCRRTNAAVVGSRLSSTPTRIAWCLPAAAPRPTILPCWGVRRRDPDACWSRRWNTPVPSKRLGSCSGEAGRWTGSGRWNAARLTWNTCGSCLTRPASRPVWSVSCWGTTKRGCCNRYAKWSRCASRAEFRCTRTPFRRLASCRSVFPSWARP